MKKQIVITVEVDDFHWISESLIENNIENLFKAQNEAMFSDLGVDIKNVIVEVLAI